MSNLLSQAEALIGFSTDLERRLSGEGVGGVTGIVDRFSELKKALDQVSAEELSWAKREIGELVSTLSGVADQLDRLHSIKGSFAES